MKAVTWQGKRDVRVEDVPDPTIQEPTDAIIKITSTNICGSDLHLYETLGAFMDAGDVMGHEPMGVVEEVGSDVGDLKVGDRVVIPFQISCGHCYMCDKTLYTQCETTQVRDQGMGAALFGFSKLYGQVPGGQAEYLRVPQAQFTHIKVPDGPPDERFVYLSDVLPTAWQSVQYADVPDGGSVTILGLGPIGDMAARIAQHQGKRVLVVDLVPERLDRARTRGLEVFDTAELGKDLPDAIRDATDGRGTDSVIDAVGMEAHGSPVARALLQATSMLPDAIAAPMAETRRRRPARRAAFGHRHRPPRRHRVIDRRLRRRCRPHAASHHVRQADPVSHGTGQRQEMGPRHPAAAHRRRPPRRRALRHPPPTPRRRRPRLRDLPEETRRSHQDRAPSLASRGYRMTASIVFSSALGWAGLCGAFL